MTAQPLTVFERPSLVRDDGSEAVFPSLRTLIDRLGATVVEVVAAPQGEDIAVADVVVHDPVHPTPLHEHDLLLAPGLREAELEDCLTEAGIVGLTAVATKVDPESRRRLAKAAERAGVALLALAPEVEWGHAYSIVRTALLSAGTMGDDAEMGDLFTLANAIGALCRGPVVIHDPHWRLVAYSTDAAAADQARQDSIFGRRAPMGWIARFREEGLVSRLFSGEVVQVGGEHHPGLSPRMAIGVRACDEILGTIWVLEADEPFGDETAKALKEAARLSALHLIRRRVAKELRRRSYGELLQALLQGRGAPDVLANRLGLPPDTPVVVTAFEAGLADYHELKFAIGGERLLRLLTTYSDALRLRAAQVVIDDVVYVLLPLLQRQDRSGVLRTVEELHRQASTALHVPLRAAVGRTVPGFSRVPESRADVELILRVLRDRSTDGVTMVEDVRESVVLKVLEDLAQQRPELLEGKIADLASLDADQGSMFVETLRALFRANMNARAAARQLGIHPNTFRYRVQRIAELTGLDLEQPDERFVAELQTRLLPAVSSH